MKNKPQGIELIPSRGVNINKKKFGRRIQQLESILNDRTYVHANSRKITYKMQSAITKIVKKYAKHINPDQQIKRLEYIEKTLKKIHSIRSLLDKCNYTSDYRYGKDVFLDSIENQVRQRAYLSQKQRVYLNKFHEQFSKKHKKS